MFDFGESLRDGTFSTDEYGNIGRVTLTHGYTVAIRPIHKRDDIKPNTLIGKWTDPETGIVYWDEVEVIESLLEAGNVARQRGEIAIWDNLNNKEFRV